MNKPSFANYSTLSLSVLFVVSACSSDSPDAVMANPLAPAPAAPAAPATMTDEGEATDEVESSEGSMEGAPTNVGLVTPPAAPNAGSGEPVGANPAAPGEPAGPMPTPVAGTGCGSTQAVASGRFDIDVAGNTREYILALPTDYDATRPYRLIFTWHPGGGSAQGTANNYYGLRALADNSAIFVSPEGINEGWANTGGRDIAFLDAMLEWFNSELCVDQSKIFSTGFSYGGMMSFAIGCGRADVFRAIAPMSGALYSGCPDGDAPIAMLGFHGTTDTVVPLANGVTARNTIAERSGCQPAAMAVTANGCLNFQGCSEGHSVSWCEFNGGHTPAPQSAQRIWEFFSQF